jgi:hypothetical protein
MNQLTAERQYGQYLPGHNRNARGAKPGRIGPDPTLAQQNLGKAQVSY